MLGVINFLKPPGMSSAQAVAFIKRLSGVKTGHAGTLDPEAAGVLPILLGRATRIADYLMGGRKVYLAEIAFGAATDTQDAQGRVTARAEGCPDADALCRAFSRFTGSISQLPPQYSALKKDGVPAYKLAREGKQAALEARAAEIHRIDLIRRMPNRAYLLRVACGKGTYIRTLCHDLGAALSCPAHMRLLIREESAGLRIEDACTAEELQEAGREGLSGFLKAPDEALGFLPRITVPAGLTNLLSGGVRITRDDPRLGNAVLPKGPFLLYAGEDFVGVFEAGPETLRVKTMLYQPKRVVLRYDT